MKIKPPLVYDNSTGGHRDRDAYVLSRVVGGTTFIAPTRKAFWKIVRHTGPVICQTADYYLAPFGALCILRALLGRRTIGLCYRNDLRPVREHVKAFLRRNGLRLLSLLPSTYVLKAFPPADLATGKDWIFDTEWWDLAVEPLPKESVALPLAADKRSVIFVGNLASYKGIDFFISAAETAENQAAKLQFVIIGNMRDLPEVQLHRFRRCGGIVLDDRPNDAQFIAYLRLADFLWCCYAPSYDQSSGVFGRALQLGIPTIVREGSFLSVSQRSYGEGVAVEYGQAEDLVRMMLSYKGARQPKTRTDEMASHAVNRLREVCGFGRNRTEA